MKKASLLPAKVHIVGIYICMTSKVFFRANLFLQVLNRVTQFHRNRKTAFVQSFNGTFLFFGVISSLWYVSI